MVSRKDRMMPQTLHGNMVRDQIAEQKTQIINLRGDLDIAANQVRQLLGTIEAQRKKLIELAGKTDAS